MISIVQKYIQSFNTFTALKNCSYPHTLNNGIIEVKNTNVGSSIRYSCTNQNHELIGAPERTCLLNGRWSGSTPICFDSTAGILCYWHHLPLSIHPRFGQYFQSVPKVILRGHVVKCMVCDFLGVLSLRLTG